jgi:hypothetical protein
MPLTRTESAAAQRADAPGQEVFPGAVADGSVGRKVCPGLECAGCFACEPDGKDEWLMVSGLPASANQLGQPVHVLPTYVGLKAGRRQARVLRAGPLPGRRRRAGIAMRQGPVSRVAWPSAAGVQCLRAGHRQHDRCQAKKAVEKFPTRKFSAFRVELHAIQRRVQTSPSNVASPRDLGSSRIWKLRN